MWLGIGQLFVYSLHFSHTFNVPVYTNMKFASLKYKAGRKCQYSLYTWCFILTVYFRGKTKCQINTSYTVNTWHFIYLMAKQEKDIHWSYIFIESLNKTKQTNKNKIKREPQNKQEHTELQLRFCKFSHWIFLALT